MAQDTAYFKVFTQQVLSKPVDIEFVRWLSGLKMGELAMGTVVIVGYKPITGKEKELDLLMKTHVPRLRAEGLVTDKASILMRANDGTVVEVFEWKSKEAIESAHTNPVVLKMWEEYAQICEYVPLNKLEETGEMFAEFSSVE